MLGSNKRHRGNDAYSEPDNPPPEALRRALNALGHTFYNSRSRNIENINTNNCRLFALITHYESSKFLWIQPSRIITRKPTKEYANYLALIQREFGLGKNRPLGTVELGKCCLAVYQSDNHWYRGVIAGPPRGDKYPVLFIDYGNIQYTGFGSLAEPVGEPGNYFEDLPCQAICCRLYNIVPQMPQYSDIVDRTLESQFTKSPARYYEVVVRNIRTDYVVDVDMYMLPSSDSTYAEARFEGRHLGQQLVDEGYAKFSNSGAAIAPVLLKMEKSENLSYLANDGKRF